MCDTEARVSDKLEVGQTVIAVPAQFRFHVAHFLRGYADAWTERRRPGHGIARVALNTESEHRAYLAGKHLAEETVPYWSEQSIL